MHFFLAWFQAATNLKHVHVVVMAVTCKGRKIHVFLYDILDGAPIGLNIAADAPRSGDVFRPNTGESPSANVDGNRMSGLSLDGFADGSVSFLLLKVEPCAGTAVVYLDEIKAPIAEIQSGILLFVPIKAGTEAMVVGIILRTARVCTRIGVDSSHQAFRMYVVGHHFQPIRKTLRVRLHLARCISPAKEAVVDVDMGVAHVFQAQPDHCVGLCSYQ